MTASEALARLLAAPIAHRGLHACGQQGAVENSLGAAETAIAGGYGIECDILSSRDGEAMVFHDASLARLTGHAGDLADHDAAALTAMRLVDGPDRIPTLAAFLAAIDGRTPLVIEIKSDHDGDMRLVDRALALIAGYRGVVALESFDPAILAHCRRVGVRRPIGLVGPLSEYAPPDPAGLAASDFLSWNIARLATVRDAGLPLSTWTVRTGADQAAAERAGAQIVFEGLRPSIAR